MLQALGYRFINENGKEIPCPMCGEKLNQLKQAKAQTEAEPEAQPETQPEEQK